MPSLYLGLNNLSQHASRLQVIHGAPPDTDGKSDTQTAIEEAAYTMQLRGHAHCIQAYHADAVPLFDVWWHRQDANSGEVTWQRVRNVVGYNGVRARLRDVADTPGAYCTTVKHSRNAVLLIMEQTLRGALSHACPLVPRPHNLVRHRSRVLASSEML